MARTNVQITPGAGVQIETTTPTKNVPANATAGDRQSFVQGDPDDYSALAAVDPKSRAARVLLAQALRGVVNGQDFDTIGAHRASRPDSFNATLESADASSATVVKPGIPGKRIFIEGYCISSGVAVSVRLQDNAPTPNIIVPKKYMAINSSFAEEFQEPIPVDGNLSLMALASGAGNVSVQVYGYMQ